MCMDVSGGIWHSITSTVISRITYPSVPFQRERASADRAIKKKIDRERERERERQERRGVRVEFDYRGIVTRKKGVDAFAL